MSGRKNTLLPFIDPLITAKSVASSFTGTAINVQYLDNVAVQLVWTGANPIGTAHVQVSLDNVVPVTWNTITPVDIALTGSAGSAFIDLNQMGARWIRVTYTTAGGSIGLLTATIGAKML